MKVLKKVCVIFVALFFLAGFVWAEGSGEKSAGGKQKQVTLTVWEHSPQFEAPLKATLDNFMKKNPDIKVEYEIKTPNDYMSLLITSIQAGEAPDLFWHHGTATNDMENLVGMGALMDLTKYLDISNYSKMSRAKVTYKGKIYQTPAATVDTRAVYYNKDLFKEKGWKVPSNLGEFEALLPVIKNAGYIPISLAGRFNWNILFLFEPILAATHPDWIQEATVGKARYNDPRVIDAMKTMIEWGKKGYYGKFYMGVDETGQYLAFSKGKATMTVGGSWIASTLKKNNPSMHIGAFQMPTADGHRPMVLTYAAGFSVYSKTKHPKEAIKLAQYLTTLESQQIWVAKLGAIPGLKGIKSTDELANEIAVHDMELESFYNIMVLHHKKGQSPTKYWEENDIKLLSGAIDPKKFTDTLDSMMNYPGM